MDILRNLLAHYKRNLVYFLPKYDEGVVNAFEKNALALAQARGGGCFAVRRGGGVMYDKAKFKACVDWYKANRDMLLSKYRGQYVVCTADSVVGAWDDFDFAIDNAVNRGIKPGMFMVHKCVPPEEEEVAYFHSPRVDFSRTAL